MIKYIITVYFQKIQFYGEKTTFLQKLRKKALCGWATIGNTYMRDLSIKRGYNTYVCPVGCNMTCLSQQNNNLYRVALWICVLKTAFYITGI